MKYTLEIPDSAHALFVEHCADIAAQVGLHPEMVPSGKFHQVEGPEDPNTGKPTMVDGDPIMVPGPPVTLEAVIQRLAIGAMSRAMKLTLADTVPFADKVVDELPLDSITVTTG